MSFSSSSLVVTTAPLLPGRLSDCALASNQEELIRNSNDNSNGHNNNGNSNNPLCQTGGMVAVQAWARFYSRPPPPELEDNTIEDGTASSTARIKASTFTDDENDNATSSNDNNNNNPILVVPMGDFKSPLTTLSRFGFGVNALLFSNEFHWRTWTVPAYTLWPGRLPARATRAAQAPQLPAVLSNVFTQPHEAWHPYVESIHYDDDTQLALLYVTKQYLSNTVEQLPAAAQLLARVRVTNEAQRKCRRNYDYGNNNHRIRQRRQEDWTTLSDFAQEPFSEWWRHHEATVLQALAQNQTLYVNATQEEEDDDNNNEGNNYTEKYQGCYRPVIVFDDKSKTQWETFYQGMTEIVTRISNDGNNNADDAWNLMEDDGPTSAATIVQQQELELPIAIVDVWGHHAKKLGEKTVVTPLLSSSSSSASSSSQHHNNDKTQTWLVSYKGTPTDYRQVKFNWKQQQQQQDEAYLEPNNRVLESVELIQQDLENLPENVQTQEYYQDLDNIRQYAREAAITAIITQRGTPSLAMPATTNSDGQRLCYLGECPFGNLAVDALRHLEGADVGFLPSFLFNGPGWDARPVHYLDVLENLPYFSQRCGGRLSGLSLLRVLQNSLDKATFGPTDGTSTGGRLLQVSGMQIVYNSRIPKNEHRILSVHVWNREVKQFVPLEKTKIYSFATNVHMCKTFNDFPPLIGEGKYETPELGEVPGSQRTEVDMKEEIQEYIVSRFGNSFLEPKIERRLVDDPTSTDTPLNWTYRSECLSRNEQTSGEVEEGDQVYHYWHIQLLECLECSRFQNVQFSKPSILFKGQALQDELMQDQLIITNHEHFPVEVFGETLSLPSHIELSITAPARNHNSTDGPPGMESWVLETNERLIIDIFLDPSDRVPGTDTSALLFGLLDFDETRGGMCPGTRIKYNVVAELSLSVRYNHLGGVAAFGYTSAALVILTSLSFAAWVARRRKARVVRTLQPIFLITLSLGVMLIGASLIPLSIDDGVASERGNDIACMSKQFLLSQGFIISVAALFCKLLRINKVVEETELFRRNKVAAKDVLLPGVILVALVFVFMLTWSIAEPMKWERYEVDHQPWSTYGKCTLGDEGTVGKAMGWSTLSVCALGFFLTCWQAFKARNISSEFSESRYLGIAVYSWLQLCFVGVPVYFLVDEDDVVVKYSMMVGLIFVVCMSMLLVVFVPILTYQEKYISRDSSSMLQAISPAGSNIRIAMASIPEHSELSSDLCVLDGMASSSSKPSSLKSSNPPSYESSLLSLQGKRRTRSSQENDDASESKDNGPIVADPAPPQRYFPLVVAQRRENRFVSELSDAHDSLVKFDSVVEESSVPKQTETLPLYGDDEDATNSSEFNNAAPENAKHRSLYDDDSVTISESTSGVRSAAKGPGRRMSLYDDDEEDEADDRTEPNSSESFVGDHENDIFVEGDERDTDVIES